MTTFREEIYPVFLPGQVLSSGRLNEIIRYLDGENRATRTDLTGTGIACGLEAEWVSGAVHIKSGYGVSSDGYLLSLPCPEGGGDHIFTKLEPWTDESKESIFDYTDTNGDVQQIPLFRLLKDNESAPLISTEFTPSDTPVVVMLYLSVQEMDPEGCGVDCDDQGKTVQTELVPLIVEKSALTNPQFGLSFAEEDILEDSQIEKLAGRRLQLAGQPDLNLSAAQDPDILQDSYAALIDDAKKPLADAILSISNRYSDLLGLSAAQKQARNNAVGGGSGVLRNISPGTAYQYTYDFIQDLVAAYAIWRSECWLISTTRWRGIAARRGFTRNGAAPNRPSQRW